MIRLERATGIPAYIVAEVNVCTGTSCTGHATGRDVLVQSENDYPGVASSFGWSVSDVIVTGRRMVTGASAVGPCPHDGTDGTIECVTCGLLPIEFIAAAGDYLDAHNGAMAADPGYFEEATR